MTSPSFLRAASIVAVIAALVAVTGCGQRSSLIPKQDAQSLLRQLDSIDQQLAAGKCDGLLASIGDAQEQVNALPTSVDQALRQRIEEGLANLTTQAPRDCLAGDVTTTTETTTTVATTTTDTTPTTPTETTPVPTAPPTTTQAPPVPTTPQPTTPAPTTSTPTGGTGTGGAGNGTGGASPDTGGATP